MLHQRLSRQFSIIATRQRGWRVVAAWFLLTALTGCFTWIDHRSPSASGKPAAELAILETVWVFKVTRLPDGVVEYECVPNPEPGYWTCHSGEKNLPTDVDYRLRMLPGNYEIHMAYNALLKVTLEAGHTYGRGWNTCYYSCNSFLSHWWLNRVWIEDLTIGKRVTDIYECWWSRSEGRGGPPDPMPPGKHC